MQGKPSSIKSLIRLAKTMYVLGTSLAICDCVGVGDLVMCVGVGDLVMCVGVGDLVMCVGVGDLVMCVGVGDLVMCGCG